MSLVARVMTVLGGPGLPEPLPPEPLTTLRTWYEESCRAKATPSPDAMALATVGADGRPSVRMVLCRGVEPEVRGVVFYTNFESRKGRELDAHPYAAAVFNNDRAGLQARVEGRVERVSDAQADAYFATRDPLKKLGAWASAQSRPIASREELAQRIVDAAERLKISLVDIMGAAAGITSVDVPRPPYWGGFRIIVDRAELWTNSRGRLHDRAQWTFDAGRASWTAQRLMP